MDREELVENLIINLKKRGWRIKHGSPYLKNKDAVYIPRSVQDYSTEMLVEYNAYLKEELLKAMADYGLLRYQLGKIPEPIPDPKHGHCCTCGRCGHEYESCICEDKEILELVDKVFEL